MNPYNRTILCVDDDTDDLMMLREALGRIDNDYQIIEAFDGIHALEVLKMLSRKGELPCLIVLDINMPRMDGKQTVSALQRDNELSSIPVVLFSTSSSAVDKTFSALKKVELITKPLEYKTLFKVASRLLSFCKA